MKMFVLALAALLFATPALADEKCILQEVTSLPIIRTTPGELHVAINIGGKPHEFAVQINGLYSQIEESFINSLQLHSIALAAGTGVRGSDNMPIQEVTVPDISLGSVHVGKFPMLAVHDYVPSNDAVGSIGLDFLSKFDVEIDLKGGVLKLFSQDHCQGQGVYWTDSMAALPFQKDLSGGTTFKMQLDGKTVIANFSTTQQTAHLGLIDANYLFSLTPKSPDVTPLLSTTFGKYSAKFKSLSMDGLAINNLSVTLEPQDKDHLCYAPGPATCDGSKQLGLGLDELQRLRVFYAFREKILYVTPADAHR